LCLIVILQFEEHPLLHSSIILKYAGLSLLIVGIVLAFWAFKLLGLKRALCLNFFEVNVPGVKECLYKYVKNPLDYGIWMALVGFAVFTQSIYNLVIAVDFIIIMILHMNITVVKKQEEKGFAGLRKYSTVGNDFIFIISTNRALTVRKA